VVREHWGAGGRGSAEGEGGGGGGGGEGRGKGGPRGGGEDRMGRVRNCGNVDGQHQKCKLHNINLRFKMKNKKTAIVFG